MHCSRTLITATLTCAAGLALLITPFSATAGEPEQKKDANLVPIDLKLPKPAFKGTPKHVPAGSNLEKPRKGPRPPLLAPKGTKNVAAGRPVTASDNDPILGSAKFITDGNKSADEDAYVELGPGACNTPKIDLKHKCAIYAVVVWHYHANARVLSRT